MKRTPDIKVVALDLDAQTVCGDAVLVENLVKKMAKDNWSFVSLAAPSSRTSLVVFSRPSKKSQQVTRHTK